MQIRKLLDHGFPFQFLSLMLLVTWICRLCDSLRHGRAWYWAPHTTCSYSKPQSIVISDAQSFSMPSNQLQSSWSHSIILLSTCSQLFLQMLEYSLTAFRSHAIATGDALKVSLYTVLWYLQASTALFNNHTLAIHCMCQRLCVLVMNSESSRVTFALQDLESKSFEELKCLPSFGAIENFSKHWWLTACA